MRARRDAAVLVVAVAVLLVTALVASDQHVPAWEESAFSALNAHTVLPFAAVWPVMQLGNLGVVLVVSAVAALLRRLRLAALLLGGGVATYLLAKVVKALVERSRPDSLVSDVVVRGPDVHDYGFVSGHAAVSTIVVVLLLPYVGPRARRVLVGLAVVVALARVYVGAHLPLDVVGGAALAVAVGMCLHLVVGRPAQTSAATDAAGQPRVVDTSAVQG